VTDPLFAFGFLTVLIALYLFADGVAEIVGAFRLHESGRAWLFIGGVASIILGVLVWRQFPLSGGLAIGIMLGIKMLFAGSAMLAGASAVRSLAKAGTPLSQAV
jgi:uncharacterized membrane protein HdeD (DUF308 family)